MYKIVQSPSVECLLIDIPCDGCGTWVPKIEVQKDLRFPALDLCQRCFFRRELKN